MENCPQCNASLGEGAKSCASCGWKRSNSKVWIILGSVLGVLALLCCGGMTWLGMKMGDVVKDMQPQFTSIMLKTYRIKVVSWASHNDGLPESLEAAVDEPVGVSDDGTQVNVKMESNGRQFVDGWQHDVRYTPNEDGTFEVRSAGPDALFDTEDDMVETGSATDDLKALQDELKKAGEELGEEIKRKSSEVFGVDIPVKEPIREEGVEKVPEGGGDAPVKGSGDVDEAKPAEDGGGR